MLSANAREVEIDKIEGGEGVSATRGERDRDNPETLGERDRDNPRICTGVTSLFPITSSFTLASLTLTDTSIGIEISLHSHPKTLIEIAMVLSKNSGSFPSNSHVSATFSILLRFGEFCNPTNCEKFNADGSLMGRTNLDKSVW